MKLIIDSRENSMLANLIEIEANKMAIEHEKKWLEIPIHLQIDLIGDIPAGALPLKED